MISTMMMMMMMVCYLFLFLLPSASSSSNSIIDVKRKASKLRAEGDSLLVNGDPNGALLKYSEAIKLEPKEVKNYLKSYRVNDRLKRVTAALKDLSNAIDIDREERIELKNTLHLRANLYNSLGKCKEALEDWEEILSLGDNSENVLVIEGRDRALKCVDLIQRADRLIEDSQDYHEADRLITEAIDISRSNAIELKKKRAKTKYNKGDHFECIADAGEVVKHDRNDIEMLTLRGSAYFQLADLEMALRHAQEALQSDPDFTQAKNLHKMVNGIRRLLNSGKSLMEKREWSEAVDKFEQITTTWEIPGELEKQILLDICKCAGQLKDRPWVHRACGRALERGGEWLDGRIAYAEILSENSDGQEEWEETVRFWNSALELDRNNPHIHDGLRKAEAALKQSKTKDYYKILGLGRNCDASQVKKGYRDMAKQFHPDRHQGLSEDELKKMEKKFADVAEAYEVLSDAEKRGRYDRGEDVFPNQGGGGHHHHHHNPFQRGGGGGFQWSFNF